MVVVPVTEHSQVAEARRAAVDLAQRAGFDETARGRVAIVATEMATNLVKHGGGGQLIAQLVDTLDRAGASGGGPPEVEMLAIDKGLGIANIESAMEDGYSTAGSAGHGLGAIRRQAKLFNIYSPRGGGTIVAARLDDGTDFARRLAGRSRGETKAGRIGALCVAMRGEEVCGDDWRVHSHVHGQGGRRVLMVVDGLGHGPHAAEASAEAVRQFNKHADRSPAEIMEALHAGLRATRGAAISIAQFDAERRMVVFCGIGNVTGVLASRRSSVSRRMISLNGTVGHVLRKIQQIDYPYPEAGAPVVILHSDGISSHWALDRYPGLVAADPSLLAAALYRDFARDRDDATVLVAHDLGGES